MLYRTLCRTGSHSLECRRCSTRLDNVRTRLGQITLSRSSSVSNNPQQLHDELGPFTYRDARCLLVLMVFLIAAWIVLSSLVPVLLLFGIVILLAMVLNPVVVWLERHHVPRAISVALVLLRLSAIAFL